MPAIMTPASGRGRYHSKTEDVIMSHLASNVVQPQRGALIVVALALALAACGKGGVDLSTGPATQLRAEVARTTHGIAHIRADDFRGLG
ncbi:MAG: hypothetical protein ACXW2S_20010 [Telluria sp.]